MRILAATLALVTSSLWAEDTSTINRAWVSEPVSEQYGKFQTVTIHPCPNDKKLLAAYCEREEAWWGHMRVYKQSGDRVEWAATFPDEYIKERGHYVVSSRWTSFPMLENPVLELIESTHMGNGSLWLMELEGRQFRLLLHIPIRGRFWSTDPEFGIPLNGEAVFEGSHLNIRYSRSSDSTVSVQLEGNLAITDMEGKKLPPCTFYQVCTWSVSKKVFEIQNPTKKKEAEQDVHGNTH